MELDPRQTANLAKIGITVLVGVTLGINRFIIRPHVKSERYNYYSLLLEHFLGHAGATMGFDGLFALTSNPHLTPAVLASLAGGFVSDIISPKRKNKPPQIDQMIANTLGTFAYAIPALIFWLNS